MLERDPQGITEESHHHVGRVRTNIARIFNTYGPDVAAGPLAAYGFGPITIRIMPSGTKGYVAPMAAIGKGCSLKATSSALNASSPECEKDRARMVIPVACAPV